MPGHKLGKGIPAELLCDPASLDLTEIPGTDNLHYPEGPIKEAQELAARAFGAEQTFFLVNGSTCGVHAMILSMCKPGDKLIVARDCHKSVINGMLLAGVQPVYIKPGFNSDFAIPSTLNPNDIELAIKENSDAVGVLITRPNYYGICSDIEKIAEITHSYGKLLAVDEAHGAHLKFSTALPVCAMDAGADICVQSAHKTLPALTQSAYLHIKGDRIDAERLRFYLSALQTSSPSYILMAALDIAREIMERRGEDMLEQLLLKVDIIEKRLIDNGFAILGDRFIKEGSMDRTRLVVNLKQLGSTGFEIDRLLRKKYNIQVEMADLYNLVCITTVADQKSNFDRLEAALAEISDHLKDNPGAADIIVRDLKVPPLAIDPREILNRKGRKVKLQEAVGRISKTIITPYPPGIPVICPGEVILEDAVEYICSIVSMGGVVNGLEENFNIFIAE